MHMHMHSAAPALPAYLIIQENYQPLNDKKLLTLQKMWCGI